MRKILEISFRHRIPRSVGVSTFLVGLTLGIPLWADSFQFSLIPADGTVSAAAGSTAGWGYSITNDSSSDWLVTTNLTSGLFSDGTPSLLFDFPVLAPDTTVTEIYDSVSASGLYAFTWDASAPPESLNSGDFALSAEWWDGDPFSGGNFLNDAPDSSASYLVTVGAPAVGTPEPSMFPICVAILVLSIVTQILPRNWLPTKLRNSRST